MACRMCTPHRYPAHLIEVFRSHNGRDVKIRPILPEDEALEQAFVRSLSRESRYNRFQYELRELPPKMLREFTHIDYERHLALIVIVSERGEEIAIGDARYVVNPDGASADIAGCSSR
jgi:acetyltransferase